MNGKKLERVVVLLVLLTCVGCVSGSLQADQGSSGEITDNAGFAQELVGKRNAFVGDASADGALLEALNISEDLGPYTFELQTEEEPYVLRILFTDKVADPAALDREMRENALLLLALIDNASEVQWQYTAGASSDIEGDQIEQGFSLDQANALLGSDVKTYGQTAEKVQSLLDWLDENGAALVNESTGTSEEVDGELTDDLDAQISAAIIQANVGKYVQSDYATESHTILKTVESADTITVYAMALYLEFTYLPGGLEESGGSHMPVAITFTKDADGGYALEEYWEPQDGTLYAPSIEEKFPADIEEDAMDAQDAQQYVLAEIQECYAKAVAHGNVDTDTILANLIETIASSPAEASNPGAYIEANAYEYRELLYYGDATLRYAYARFLAGGQTDLQSQILLSAMRELLGDEDPDIIADGSAQSWFDQWKDQAVSLRDANSMAYMEEHYPKTALMLVMASSVSDNTVSDAAQAAIDEVRLVLALPLSPLEFVKDGSMINSPSGALKVAFYQDTEGRQYSYAPETGRVVEIDARAILSARSTETSSEPASDLEKMASVYAQSISPDFEARQSSLSFEAGEKGDKYFFTWYGEMQSGKMNRPFLQFGMSKDGTLFAYYNTLDLAD